MCTYGKHIYLSAVSASKGFCPLQHNACGLILNASYNSVNFNLFSFVQAVNVGIRPQISIIGG